MSGAMDWLKSEMIAIEAQKLMAQAEAATYDDTDAPRRIPSWGAIVAGKGLCAGGGRESHVVPTGYGWGAACRAACGRKTSDLNLDYVHGYMEDPKTGEAFVTCAECRAAQRKEAS